MKIYKCDAYRKPGTAGGVQKPTVQARYYYGAKALFEAMAGSKYNIRHASEVI